jgi:clan AA aspartic protease
MSIRPARRKGVFMGITHVSATVKPVIPGGSSVTADFLVDTGAIDCVVPASLLRRAGIEPERADLYELADGGLVELPVAAACIEFMDSIVLTRVIFGAEEAEPLLGAMALEYAGFVVDPTSQTLRRLRARLLKKVRLDRVYTRLAVEKLSRVCHVGEREEAGAGGR